MKSYYFIANVKNGKLLCSDGTYQSVAFTSSSVKRWEKAQPAEEYCKKLKAKGQNEIKVESGIMP